MFVQLTGGAYQSRSLIAAAQRCVNLFTEATPQAQGEQFPAVHYCTPGLTLQAAAPQDGCRGLYTTYSGDLYAVYGQQVLHIDANNQWTSLGTFHPSDPSDAVARDTPVSMSDNGTVLVIVDGSVDGWFVDLTQPIASQTITRIDRGLNSGFYGADVITFQDTFFILNKPDTAIFYISLSNINADNFTAAFNVQSATIVAGGAGSGAAYSTGDILDLTGTGGAQVTVESVDAGGGILNYGNTNGGAVVTKPANPVPGTGGTGHGATFTLTYTDNVGAFDPLDFASMSAQANKLVAAVSMHRNLFLIGTTSFEVWINNGGDGTSTGSFPFAIFPEAYGNWGCTAKYSIASMMNQLFWLHQDKFGHGMVMRGEGLAAKRISTHAIEFEISQYPTITDAVGYCYQQQGHIFYLLTFPSANNYRGATWCFDGTTNEWAERLWIDGNGLEYRHLGNAASGAYNQVYVGDWGNGNLYTFDLTNYTDNGNPIKRVRSFPHQLDLEANRRIRYEQLIANMQTGSATQTGPAMRIVDCDFVASDGTLLENYSNINSFGATFTKLDTVEALITSDAVVAQAPGAVLYAMTGTPTSADYTVSYEMIPTSYSIIPAVGTEAFIIGRANASHNGYKASIISDGAQYLVHLVVMGGTTYSVPLGTLSASAYAVILSMQSTAISVSVYRIHDGLWMDADGTWVGSPTIAIAIVDSTYTASGGVLLGGFS